MVVKREVFDRTQASNPLKLHAFLALNRMRPQKTDEEQNLC